MGNNSSGNSGNDDLGMVARPADGFENLRVNELGFQHDGSEQKALGRMRQGPLKLEACCLYKRLRSGA